MAPRSRRRGRRQRHDKISRHYRWRADADIASPFKAEQNRFTPACVRRAFITIYAERARPLAPAKTDHAGTQRMISGDAMRACRQVAFSAGDNEPLTSYLLMMKISRHY